ncbi:alpha/beta hydrolase [Actinoalloteichus caeruleus]|uniref:Acetyl esterase/lipase n=1 Tax=Actinoalloteichus caeruleus DSM 43889 TaxID=1120930 RepID=A0ABT1JCJ0_ACTCY|nr:alpha/beta hydrolase [Actinoalloteichus caeruleus]MCP2330201.1 Acetyl esterase/lipase [Actinoalloteichus caeruleus DSM 43889]
MDLSSIAPELRSHVRRMPRLPLRQRWARRLVRAAGATLPAPPEVAGTSPRRPADAAPGVRVHRPHQVRSDAALLWIHGGGLVIGSAAQDDRFCAETARDLGITVVAAEYRLAPEHRHPAALDDCHAAWTWVRDHADELGVDTARIAVGGQSAGGGLAAALVQRLHDLDQGRPAAQWLLCPMLDDRTAARRHLDSLRHAVWDNRLNRFGWRSYLGVEPGAPDVPPGAVPARRADLRGLPATWIGVGDVDLFHTENRVYARRLRAAGVDTTHVVRGAPHGFESWAAETRIAREFLAEARTWLDQRLHRTGAGALR